MEDVQGNVIKSINWVWTTYMQCIQQRKNYSGYIRQPSMACKREEDLLLKFIKIEREKQDELDWMGRRF